MVKMSGTISIGKNGTAVKYNREDGLIYLQLFGKGTVHHMEVKDATSLVDLLQKAIIEAKGIEESNRGMAPQGKAEVKGLIVSTDYVANKFHSFGTLKMLVKLENQSTVWGTVPRNLYNQMIRFSADIKGSVIQFSADFTREKSNPLHGNFKRPTKAVLLKPVKKEEEPIF